VKLRRLAALCALTSLAAASVAAVPVALKSLDLGHGPTIVFVHGLGGSRMSWMPTSRKLLGGYHIVMVDLAGHGDSPMPDPFSLDAAAEALDAVLAKQNPESTIVVGHALGGLVSLMALSAHPEHARGLLLIDTQLKSPIPIADQQKRYVIEYMDENYDAFLRAMFTRMGRDSTQGIAIHAVAAAVPAANMKAYLRELLSVDATKAAKALKTPMQLLLTDRLYGKDKTWGVVAKQMGWEDTTLVVPRRVSNAGYLVMSDQPDTLAAMITEFATARLTAKK
jgi:pimeloyl-ACP methyl ester carboxylesterase